ncbi:MAG: acyl-CoA dehydrogenase, partial [Candidatus Geothermincolia bacterium]
GWLLTLGELFTLVAYGQLILENAEIYGVSDELVDQIFDFMVRDFSKYALELYQKTSSTDVQMKLCTKMIMKPVADEARFNKVLEEAYSLRDQYHWSD